MKLTKAYKAAFVRQVLADIPQVDYNRLARDLIVGEVLSQFDENTLALYKNPKTRPHLRSDWYSTPSPLSTVSIPGCRDLYKPSDELVEEIRSYARLAKQQEETLKDLKIKLTLAIEPCTTLNRARELLPEFEKYLPEETKGSPTLPAIANLVTSLLEAGWNSKS